VNRPAYDYLVVGAGLFGAVFAREMTDSGARCLVIEQRQHIAGNCYTELVEGVQVHRYGPHIFHTDSAKIWQYVQQFAEFNNFTYRPRVYYRGKLYSFPINLMTLNQLWGVTNPAQAEAKLCEVREHDADTANMEGWLLSQVGREIYETFYKGYTMKQWGRDPALLPASIAARLPIRLTFDDNYYTDRYQGIPIGGYTGMIAGMLCGIEVRLGADYFAEAPYFRSVANRTVYSGPIDKFFGYRQGKLEYRSLRFEQEIVGGDYQGVAAVNYTDFDTPYTRIVEHKHFEPGRKVEHSVITREYPIVAAEGNEPFYPVNDARNNAIYAAYTEMALHSGVLFGGRLAAYKYYDMHHVIGQAMAMAGREMKALGVRR
jgi:UDP-galactopyranose mutase